MSLSPDALPCGRRVNYSGLRAIIVPFSEHALLGRASPPLKPVVEGYEEGLRGAYQKRVFLAHMVSADDIVGIHYSGFRPISLDSLSLAEFSRSSKPYRPHTHGRVRKVNAPSGRSSLAFKSFLRLKASLLKPVVVRESVRPCFGDVSIPYYDKSLRVRFSIALLKMEDEVWGRLGRDREEALDEASMLFNNDGAGEDFVVVKWSAVALGLLPPNRVLDAYVVKGEALAPSTAELGRPGLYLLLDATIYFRLGGVRPRRPRPRLIAVPLAYEEEAVNLAVYSASLIISAALRRSGELSAEKKVVTRIGSTVAESLGGKGVELPPPSELYYSLRPRGDLLELLSIDYDSVLEDRSRGLSIGRWPSRPVERVRGVRLRALLDYLASGGYIIV